MGTPHRYWRILFTAGAASNEVDLGHVKFYDTVDIDAATTAASTGGTAFSGENFSGSYLPSKSFNYANAEQGDLWASTNNASTWGTLKYIGYDLGSGNEKDIVAYGFVPYSTTYAPSAWKFQYSDDGSSWTDVHTVTGYTFQYTNIEIFRVPSAVGGTGFRYWRIYHSGSGSGGSVGELELRLTIGGANALSMKYSSLSMDSVEGSSFATYGPRKALDGNTGFLSYTARCTAASSAAHWWMADFGKKVLMAQAVMTNGIMSETRGSVKVQASNDLATWYDFGEFPAFSADYQQKTMTLSAPAGALRRRQMIVCS